MNLIEQLGGYEKAKAFLNATSFTIDELIMMQRSGLRTQHVEKALLEYRRQHNIFEVGDDVVLSDGNCTLMYKLHERIGKYVYLKRPSGREYDFNIDQIRHATDAEIKAGKRLEVNE